jgi:hypothetical protein
MFEHPVCETCFHYVGDTIDGQCRRYPPTKTTHPGSMAEFVRVYSYSFCGEWKPLQIKEN